MRSCDRGRNFPASRRIGRCGSVWNRGHRGSSVRDSGNRRVKEICSLSLVALRMRKLEGQCIRPTDKNPYIRSKFVIKFLSSPPWSVVLASLELGSSSQLLYRSLCNLTLIQLLA